MAEGDAALTVVWQEPVGALRASAIQDDLAGRYGMRQARFARTRLASARTTMLERAHAAAA